MVLTELLKINVLKNLLNENSVRKYIGQQVGGFSAAELHLFTQCAQGNHTCKARYAPS
jgi:hypothetical protein